MDERLRSALVARFEALNGAHPMTPEDDVYVAEWFAPLEELTDDADVAARRVLAGQLPLPSYVTSTGTPMFTRDLLSLPERAGGIRRKAELVEEIEQLLAAGSEDDVRREHPQTARV